MTRHELTKEKREVKVNLYCRGLTLIGGDSNRIRLRDKYATRPTIYTKRKTCVKREADHGLIM